MDFEVHCMFILPTELSLFNYEKVKTVLQSVTPLKAPEMRTVHTASGRPSLTLRLTSKQDAVSLKFQVSHKSQKYADR